VDHVAAGEVEGADAGDPAQPAREGSDPAAAPDAERVDRVDDGDPYGDEDHPGLEARAAEDRAEEQDDRDGREHELEIDERGERELEIGNRALEQRDHGLALKVIRGQDRPGHAEEVEGVGERGAEGHLECPEAPHEQDGAERVEDHQRRVERPLALHEA
jgi:hypothetical protein